MPPFLNCASAREVVPNGAEVVTNEREVVPNGLEVVPGNGKFLHPPKKTNEITGTCHDVTTSSRHIGPVNICREPALNLSVFGIRDQKLGILSLTI